MLVWISDWTQTLTMQNVSWIWCLRHIYFRYTKKMFLPHIHVWISKDSFPDDILFVCYLIMLRTLISCLLDQYVIYDCLVPILFDSCCIVSTQPISVAQLSLINQWCNRCCHHKCATTVTIAHKDTNSFPRCCDSYSPCNHDSCAPVMAIRVTRLL